MEANFADDAIREPSTAPTECEWRRRHADVSRDVESDDMA
jgi:hypothetical protein